MRIWKKKIMSKKIFTGTVVSNKMEKTVVVAVDMLQRHPVYEKVLKRTKRIKAHDELDVQEGDIVVIEESRPYSKQVSFKVIQKVEEEK